MHWDSVGCFGTTNQREWKCSAIGRQTVQILDSNDRQFLSVTSLDESRVSCHSPLTDLSTGELPLALTDALRLSQADALRLSPCVVSVDLPSTPAWGRCPQPPRYSVSFVFRLRR
ncbi:MAG: hypothetical protein CL920_33860 [Deltaproteobacteria bacterium]|nr:hypothetical protein [Deltaproteobacteria bacterium]MBU53708.1 hypothetical protein [Deltaproteobacteria bacterium]